MKLPNKKILIITTASTLGVLCAVNIGLWAYYNNHTYPQTFVRGHQLAHKSETELVQHIQQHAQPPTEIQLYKDNLKATAKTADMGIRLDAADSLRSMQSRSPVPMLAFFQKREITPTITIDQTKLDAAVQKLAEVFRADATDARITADQDSFKIASAKSGFTTDAAKLKEQLVRAAKLSNSSIEVSVKTTEPAVVDSSLQVELTSLQGQLSRSITFTYLTNKVSPSKKDLITWYAPQNNKYAPDAAAIKRYVSTLGNGWGITVANTAEAAQKAQQALGSDTSTTIALIKYEQKRYYSYCIGLRGVGSEHAGTFAAKLQNTLNASHGWALGGSVVFTKTAQNCNFTAWLASADQVPSFGGVCDSTWSCRIGNSVVINFDRWQNASPAWNAAGGSLDDYRSMVINHEVGHWFEFGHRNCSGSGKPAPVMQQQSIDLQGCTFNPWPTQAELADFRKSIRL